MSDSAEAAPAEATAKAAGPKAKTSKAVLALLVLNLGGTGFGVFKVMTAGAHEAHAAEKIVEVEKSEEIKGPIVALDPFITNLDETGSARYLKVTLNLELLTHEAEEALTKNKQVIHDVVLSHLSGLKLKDTLGAEAKETLRKQLTEKLEKIVGEHKIRRMFFQEFVVQ